MKRNRIHHLVALLLGALLLGACNQRSSHEEALIKSDTNTSIRFAVRVATDHTLRGVNQDQKDVPGTDNEQKVEQGLVLFKDYASMPAMLREESAGIWKSPLLELKAGIQSQVQMTLLLNSNPIFRPSTRDFTKNREIELKDLLSYAGINLNGMLMTATVEQNNNTVTIDNSATEQEVMQGSKNNFSFDVERVVAKVQITKSSSVTAELKNVGTLKLPLTYSMAGSAKKSYLFRDRAGERTLTESSPNIYKDYVSLIDAERVPTDWDPKQGHPFLQRVSDKEGTDYILNGYYRNPKEVKDKTANPVSIDGGFYFLENSMYGNNKVASKKGEIKYNRIAYAKVYAQLDKITHCYEYDYKAKKPRLMQSDSLFRKAHTYSVEISEELFYRLRRDPKYRPRLDNYYEFSWDEDNNTVGRNVYKLKFEEQPGTFYVGASDGAIYLTLRDALLCGNKQARRYTHGRMVYLIPINRQKDASRGFVNYCDTRRNNIYDLCVSSISGIGLNYDPIDPDDPNIPKPDDTPFEPPIDPQKPVEERANLIRVKANILQWNEVVRHVDVGRGRPED